MLGFLIAVAAGFLVPHVAGPIGKPVADMMRRHITLEENEGILIGYGIMAIAAGLLATIFDSSNPFWVTLGVFLGYFLLRISAVIRDVIENKPSS